MSDDVKKIAETLTTHQRIKLMRKISQHCPDDLMDLGLVYKSSFYPMGSSYIELRGTFSLTPLGLAVARELEARDE